LIIDGYFEGEFHTLFRSAHVRLRLEGGRLVGATSRGVRIDGHYGFDQARGTYRFEITAHLPPLFEALTGLRTGMNGRTVQYGGEVALLNEQARFSIDFAGRAIDVLVRRVGPLETVPDVDTRNSGSRAHDPAASSPLQANVLAGRRVQDVEHAGCDVEVDTVQLNAAFAFQDLDAGKRA
jgi:hypothetical protein